jgi:hypothetical protein
LEFGAKESTAAKLKIRSRSNPLAFLGGWLKLNRGMIDGQRRVAA